MGEPPAVDRATVSLLPGCRFYPSEDQLFQFYLLNKNTNPTVSDDCSLIRELDLYSYLPFELPDVASFPYGCGGRKRHWYCYAIRTLSDQRSRRAKGGFWRRTGRVKDVLGGRGGKVLLGTRTRFVFYLGSSWKAAIRTDWIMYEYALVDHDKDSFVVCRVFIKPRSGNSTSDNLTRSYADKTAVRIPNKGHITPESATPMAVVSELNNCISIRHNLDSRFRPDSQLGDMVRTSVPVTAGQISADAVAPHELAYILEGDYIELNDLLTPLPGVD